MYLFRRYAAILAVTAAASFLIVSCGGGSRESNSAKSNKGESATASPGTASPSITAGSSTAGSCDTSELKKIADIINDAADEGKKAEESLNPDDAGPFIRKVGDITKRAAKKLEAAEVSDKKLQEFKSRLIETYDNQRQASEIVLTATQNNDEDKLEVGAQGMEEAREQRETILKEMKSSCPS